MGAAAREDVDDVVVVEREEDVEAFLWIEGEADETCGRRGNWG